MTGPGAPDPLVQEQVRRAVEDAVGEAVEEQVDEAVDERVDEVSGAAQTAEGAAARAEDAAEESERARDGAVQAGTAAVEAAMVAAPDDPLLDTAVRRIEAQANEDNPFGVPGRPMNRRSPFRIGFTAALGVAVAYALVQSLIAVRGVLVLLLVAAFLAIGLDPAVHFLDRRGLSQGGPSRSCCSGWCCSSSPSAWPWCRRSSSRAASSSRPCRAT